MKVTNEDYRKNYPNLTIAKEKEEEQEKLIVFFMWLRDEGHVTQEEPERRKLIAQYLGYDLDKARAESETIMNKHFDSLNKKEPL